MNLFSFFLFPEVKRVLICVNGFPAVYVTHDHSEVYGSSHYSFTVSQQSNAKMAFFITECYIVCKLYVKLLSEIESLQA